jgi:lipopolysaccharide heptosyltransferase II
MTPPAWADVARVLAVRLDALGDVLMTGPALRALKAGRPGRHLTLLTSPAGAAVAQLLPGVDDVMVYEAPWMKATPPRPDPLEDLAFAARLAGAGFEAAAVFTVYSQNPLPAALLCYLAGIPRRLAHCRENPYQLLTDWVVEREPAAGIRHEVRRQLDLAAAVGCTVDDERMMLSVPAPAAARVEALLDELGLAPRGPWVALHPGASAPSRRYPAERFAAVVRGLADAGLGVVFTGSADEAELAAGIRERAGVPARSLVGRLALDELAAFLGRAPLLVSNNTGPVHIAAAMGTPVVDLYAQTNPQHTPWGVPHRVLFHDVPCKYCYKSVCPEGHHDCLRRVEPDAVVAAALDLLGDAAEAPRPA